MKKIVVFAVATAMTFGLAAVSSAQGWMQVGDEKPNTIKVGLFWPAESEVRSATKSLWFVGAYERVINETPGSNTDLTAEVGYMKRSGLQVIPITVNWRNHSSQSGFGGRGTYWGAGIGAYFIDPPRTPAAAPPMFFPAEEAPPPPPGQAGWGGDRTTKIGYNAFIGVQSDAYLAELKFHYARAYGNNVGGVVASLGYRF